MAHDGLLNL